METNHRKVGKEKGIGDGIWGIHGPVSAFLLHNCAECFSCKMQTVMLLRLSLDLLLGRQLKKETHAIRLTSY